MPWPSILHISVATILKKLLSIGKSTYYTVELAVELETAAQFRASQFSFPQRPWLDLYGINVRLDTPFARASSKQFIHPALKHQVSGLVENYKVLQLKYDDSCRKMWLVTPRLRTDGKLLYWEGEKHDDM